MKKQKPKSAKVKQAPAKLVPNAKVVPIPSRRTTKRRGRPRIVEVKMARDYRMNLMAHLYLTSTMTYDDICEYLRTNHGVDISKAQISQDFAKLRKQWQESAAIDTNTATIREINKLNTIEASAVRLLETGQTEKFCKVMLATAKRRANLLGLDKPIKVKSIPGGAEDLSDEELAAIVKNKERDEDPEKER